MRPPAEFSDLELLAADVAENVRRLKLKLPALEDMSDSRRPSRTFIPINTLRVMGEQYVKDRRARIQGMAAGFPGAGTVSPAPGNMGAWALEAEITLSLQHLVQRLLRHHVTTSLVLGERVERRAGRNVRVIYRRDSAADDPMLTVLGLAPAGVAGVDVVLGTLQRSTATAVDLAGYLYELLWTVDAIGLVRSTGTEITHLLTTVTTFLEGEEREAFGHCPFCDQPSLVLYRDLQMVRCERARDRDGRRPTCRCPYAQCPCHTDADYVHQWFAERPAGARDSLETLNVQITAARRIKETR